MFKSMVVGIASLSIVASIASFTFAGFNIPTNVPLPNSIQNISDFGSHFSVNVDEMFYSLGFSIMRDGQAALEFAQRFGEQSEEMFADLGFTILADAQSLTPVSTRVTEVTTSWRNDFVSTVGLLDQYVRDDYPELAMAEQIKFSHAQTTNLSAQLEQEIADSAQYSGLTLGLIVRSSIEKFITGSTAPSALASTHSGAERVAGTYIEKSR